MHIRFNWNLIKKKNVFVLFFTVVFHSLKLQIVLFVIQDINGVIFG